MRQPLQRARRAEEIAPTEPPLGKEPQHDEPQRKADHAKRGPIPDPQEIPKEVFSGGLDCLYRREGG